MDGTRRDDGGTMGGKRCELPGYESVGGSGDFPHSSSVDELGHRVCIAAITILVMFAGEKERG